VLGQSFSSEGLSALLATVGETGDMSGALASLVRKEIFAIESDPRSAEHGQYRFVQAMVRTVAYDTLARRDRKARHLAAARFLAEEPDADSIPAVLASHYLDAYSAAGQDEDAAELAACAVELLERAASRARDLGAPAEARRHLETALQLVTEPVEIGRLSEAAAEAALSAGASGEAATLADRARETYAGAGLEIDAARALALWGDVHISAGTGPAVIEPLSGAYESLHDRPEAAATAARLALGVARAYYLSVGDSESAIPWFDRAVTLGEALEDLPMLASTLASYSGALVLVGRSHMGLGLLRVSLEIARETGDPSAQLRSLNNLVSFLSSRDVGAAIGYADQSLAIARRLGDREWAGYLTGSAAHAYWNAGDWDSAVAVAAEWEFGDEDMSPVVALTVGYVAAIHEACGLPVSVGSISEAPTGQRADLMMEAAGPWLSAFVARATGDSDGAAAFTSSALDKFVEASGIDDDFPLIWVTAISDQLAVRDAAAARGMLALVEEAPRGHIPTLTRALLPWQRARVKVLEGDDDGVDASFAAAEAGLRDFGARFYLGRALLDHADWLQARDRAAAAVPLLEEARQIFAGLGAAPWLERAGGEPTADVGRADAAHLAG
jgi:tetratricopeptide (TPR) repeat protein